MKRAPLRDSGLSPFLKSVSRAALSGGPVCRNERPRSCKEGETPAYGRHPYCQTDPAGSLDRMNFRKRA